MTRTKHLFRTAAAVAILAGAALPVSAQTLRFAAEAPPTDSQVSGLNWYLPW